MHKRTLNRPLKKGRSTALRLPRFSIYLQPYLIVFTL